jgi:hypothetical protein
MRATYGRATSLIQMLVHRSLLGVLACCAAILLTAGPAPAALPIVDDDPAVAARGVGDMRAVIRGSDGALWTRSWGGSSWTGWSSLGGSLSSGPSISARPDGVYDVVVRGLDGAAYHKAFTPAGGWTEWTPLGGGFLSALAVSYRQGTGQIDVVGVGTDNQLYLKSFESTGWSAWGSLGGGFSGRPSIISPAAQHIEMYARGTDGQLYEKYWTAATGFSDYIPLGGALSSGVSATAWDTNRRDVFARGLDGALYLRSWTNTGGFGPWARVGGALASGPGATAVAPNRLHVFVRGGAGGQQVAVNSFSSTWSGFQNFGYAPRFTAPPAPPPVVPGPTPGSSLRLTAGFGCTPVGGRVPVRVRIKQRTSRLKPRVIKIVFFIDRGKHRRTDRRRPYKTRIRVSYKRGSKHRVHARIYFRRKGSSRVQRKTVSKRFTMCK